MKLALPSLNHLLGSVFKVEFQDDPYPSGKPDELWNEPGSGFNWSYNEDEKYWDFNINLPYSQIEKVTFQLQAGNPFKQGIRSIYASFLDELESLSDRQDPDSFKSLLNKSLNRLKVYQMKYSKFLIPYDREYVQAGFLHHDDTVIYANPEEKHVNPEFTNYILSMYFEEQKKHIRYAEVELQNALDNVDNIPSNESINAKGGQLQWLASDTDLLELIVGLIETNSVAIQDKRLSRKELVKSFEQIFSIEIKDFESKLSRATERKKDTSPYLTKLKHAFDNYCERKIDRQE